MVTKKRRQLTIAWADEKRNLWEEMAKDHFQEAPSTLGRLILEEFMACFVPAEKMRQVGLARTAEQRPGYYLPKAMSNVPSSAVSKTQQHRREAQAHEYSPERRRKAG